MLPIRDVDEGGGGRKCLFSIWHLWPDICIRTGMILLITPSARGPECSEAVCVATNRVTHIAASLSEAVTHLRSNEYSVVVLHECLLDSDPDQAELVLQHIGTATPVHVNCAITGGERLVREIRAALYRREREQQVARKAAEEILRSELREPLTALMLECELLAATPHLSPQVQAKLKTIDNLARQLSEHLQMGELAKSEC